VSGVVIGRAMALVPYLPSGIRPPRRASPRSFRCTGRTAT